ncbi:MAG: alpha-glucan family phosphorylase [bacterium]|nr:alpha-glucan family phosphorylase [bacterium]
MTDNASQINNACQPEPLVAYFSMEIALENNIKTYAGGLGVLGGDILRSAADLRFPLVGVTLFNRSGYFEQVIGANGEQEARPDKSDFLRLEKMPQVVAVDIGKEKVFVGVWRYLIKSEGDFKVPVYFLDTDLPGNTPASRELCGVLYGGNEEYRLKQEIILGRGGIKMLAAIGHQHIKKIHLNEGHGAFAAVELFLNSKQKREKDKLKEARNKCVFTTHTPLPKAQDIFSLSYLLSFQPDFPESLIGLIKNNAINLTQTGFYFSGFVNAVSSAHQREARKIYKNNRIKAITNGVDSLFWTAPEFKELYDKHIPGWRADNSLLRKVKQIAATEIWLAHQRAKKRLIDYINKKQSIKLDYDIFTIAFARRFAVYKRPEFLFQDLNRLLKINNERRLQLVYAGKAHPQDLEGRELVKKINLFSQEMSRNIKLVFLEDYDLNKARLLTAGADLWLSNPLPPNEASGTSGMKAAHNGVPQASTLDGWWKEGYKKNKTGWLIKEKKGGEIYDLLEKEILPLYYDFPEKWRQLMVSAISLNASYFNAQRVLKQYIIKAYKIKKY